MKYMLFSASDAMADDAPLHPLMVGPVCSCMGLAQEGR